jgi:hypothetical protein
MQHMKLLSMHATACASERNWSKWGRLYDKFLSALSLLKGEIMVFIAENDPVQFSQSSSYIVSAC